MPYLSRPRYRRRFRRTTRTYRRPYRGRFRRSTRRFPTRRRPRRVNWYNRTYNFKEKFQTQTFMLRPFATTGLISVGFYLTPNMLPGWANKKPMFDQIKIYKWKVVIAPPTDMGINVYNEIESNPTHGLSTCQQYLAYDYTDATAPGTVSSMLGSPACITRPWHRPIKMCIRPRLLKMAYETGTSTGNAYMPSTGWVDTDDEQTPHYGFKYLMDNTNYSADNPNTAFLMYRVIYTVYYGFKNINRPGGV